MKYNICFTLGDPSGDGHANTSEYHIVATHSVEERRLLMLIRKLRNCWDLIL